MLLRLQRLLDEGESEGEGEGQRGVASHSLVTILVMEKYMRGRRHQGPHSSYQLRVAQPLIPEMIPSKGTWSY